MKIADAQILFYAIDSTSNLHSVAANCFEAAIDDRESLGLTWPTIQQFLRLGTNPASPGYMSDEEALGWIDEWIEAGVEIVSDADLRWERLGSVSE